MVNFKDKEHFFKYRKKKAYKKIKKTHNIQLGITKPEALKSLYRSPAYRKNQLVLCKNYVLQWQLSWNSDQHKKHEICKGPSND